MVDGRAHERVAEHEWLHSTDGACAEADAEPAVARLVAVLDDVRPDTVVTFGPDGFTGHPDHRTTSRWVDAALARSTVSPRLLHAVATVEDRVDPQLDADFGVFELGQPRVCTQDEVALRLPLDHLMLRRKVLALQAQESQTSALIDAVGLDRYSAWVAVEVFADAPQPSAVAH